MKHLSFDVSYIESPHLVCVSAYLVVLLWLCRTLQTPCIGSVEKMSLSTECAPLYPWVWSIESMCIFFFCDFKKRVFHCVSSNKVCPLEGPCSNCTTGICVVCTLWGCVCTEASDLMPSQCWDVRLRLAIADFWTLANVVWNRKLHWKNSSRPFAICDQYKKTYNI